MREIEPTTLIPLRWGSYRGRYLAGLCCIFGGGALLEMTNTYFLFALFAGAAIHVGGWLILPARGWRRWVPALASVLALCALLGGPTQMPLLIVPFAGWLVARHRPPISAVTVLLPLASGVALATLLHDNGDFGLALTISAAVLTTSAWLARTIALSETTTRFRRTTGILTSSSAKL